MSSKSDGYLSSLTIKLAMEAVLVGVALRDDGDNSGGVIGHKRRQGLA